MMAGKPTTDPQNTANKPFLGKAEVLGAIKVAQKFERVSSATNEPSPKVELHFKVPGEEGLFGNASDLRADPQEYPSAKPKILVRPGGMINVRLLPVTIIVASLMFTVRLTDIWKVFSGTAEVSINQSVAQQPPPPGGRKRGQRTPKPDPAAAAPAAAPSAASPAAAPAAAVKDTATPPSGDNASGNGAPPAVSGNVSDNGEPPTFTQNEVDVLQKLSARREALDARERDLNLRENMVQAAEARIDKKIAEMKALQSDVQSMLKQVDDQDNAKMNSLVKIYETMKPKEAAKIFEQLDMPVLLGVIGHMKEQKIAPIMEAMNPMTAKAVTDAMAQHRAARTEGQGQGG